MNYKALIESLIDCLLAIHVHFNVTLAAILIYTSERMGLYMSIKNSTYLL
jgi:hypothetical protein